MRPGRKKIDLPHRHQIRLRQRESASGIAVKLGTDDDIVGAGGVVDPEGRAAAIAGNQGGEGIVRALGPGGGLPAAVGLFLGLRHEHAVMTAVKDGNVMKLIVATRAHEDAQVVRGQNGVADDVVIESEIKRDAGPGIVVEVKFREQAIRRLITGQTVELVVECGQIPHRQPPHAPRGDEAAGTAAGAGHMFHDRVAHVLHRDSVVADLRAFALKLPELVLLAIAVAVNEKAADTQIIHGSLWIVDGFTQNDHRAIGAVRKAQYGRIAGTTQALMITPQHNGLADLKCSGRQHHLPAAGRQAVQRLLDFGAGHTRG